MSIWNVLRFFGSNDSNVSNENSRSSPSAADPTAQSSGDITVDAEVQSALDANFEAALEAAIDESLQDQVAAEQTGSANPPLDELWGALDTRDILEAIGVQVCSGTLEDRAPGVPLREFLQLGFDEVLGLEPGATEKEIAKAYRREAQNHHPDKGGHPLRMQYLDAVYDILSNKKAPHLRRPGQETFRGRPAEDARAPAPANCRRREVYS